MCWVKIGALGDLRGTIDDTVESGVDETVDEIDDTVEDEIDETVEDAIDDTVHVASGGKEFGESCCTDSAVVSAERAEPTSQVFS